MYHAESYSDGVVRASFISAFSALRAMPNADASIDSYI
eukprot:CAMPEP_0196201200 /NCGR_PEP_ID=MMETSP0912-20130531/4343_1 /TAXON_ID=49265 /ORGANISM="Thalassiosira rotula, Strain GSO102" /LENGTH=37 /DNA_ID= /DNA_START= /DNA_END= /DNA_ORIENTATION=